MNARRINDMMQELAGRIGYEPGNLEHLKKAMNVEELRNGNTSNKEYVNGSIATLGDTVLKMVITEILYLEGKDRGDITKKKIEIESNENLHRISSNLGLRHYAYNSSYFYDEALANERLPNAKHEVYLEAVIGAIYLDRGLKYCKDWIKDVVIKG